VSECIFCKIVAGDVPSARVYETGRILAILDINPVTAGHTLLLAKGHVPDLLEADAEVLGALVEALPRVARAVVAATGAQGCNVLLNSGRAAGQLIDHLHVHLIPRRSGDGVHLDWRPGSYGEGELDSFRRRIAEAIRRD
jgi:histidine triad (HIT) family protein